METTKPIDQVLERINNISEDMKTIKNDISHIKEYIRKLEVREQLEEDKLHKMEKEYVKTGWFYN